MFWSVLFSFITCEIYTTIVARLTIDLFCFVSLFKTIDYFAFFKDKMSVKIVICLHFIILIVVSFAIFVLIMKGGVDSYCNAIFYANVLASKVFWLSNKWQFFVHYYRQRNENKPIFKESRFQVVLSYVHHESGSWKCREKMLRLNRKKLIKQSQHSNAPVSILNWKYFSLTS